MSIVPSNLFSLRGDPFYQLVEEITSEDIKDLLKIQKISTAQCFLNTNPLDFLNIICDDPSILQLQNRLSFRLADDNRLVLAGVNGDLVYLTELCKMYNNDNEKHQSSRFDLNRSIHIIQDSSSVATTASSVSTVSQMSILSIEDHRDYLTQQIKAWWEENRHQYHLENHQYSDPQDYQLIIATDSASIMCSCRQKINLPFPKERSHYQLSNFYKHLKMNKKCTAIKRKRLLSDCDEQLNDEDDKLNDDYDEHVDLSSASVSASASSTSSRQLRTTLKQIDQRKTEPSINRSFYRLKRRRL